MTTDRQPRHFHLFAFHRHPDWHGHCDKETSHRMAQWIHAVREHDTSLGSTCAQCQIDSRGLVEHACRRWHFHGPFRHRHTETGR